MTKEQIQARIDQLKTELNSVTSAYQGAIQEATYWLKQLEDNGGNIHPTDSQQSDEPNVDNG